MRSFFRSIATLLTVAIALLLLGSLVVIYVPPAYLSYFVYSSFLFPLFWVLNVASFLFWFMKWRTRFLIPLTALVLLTPQWSQTFQLGWHAAPSGAEKAKSVSVLSYNVRMFDLFDWSKVTGNTKRIFEFIKNKDADVVCIQEFFANNENGIFGLTTINNHFKKYPYRHITFDAGDEFKGFGMATYSKYPIVNKVFLRFKDTSNSSMYTDIVAKGETIRVFNNHLESIRLTKENLNMLDSLNYQTKATAKRGLREINFKMKSAFSIRTIQANQLAALITKSPYPSLVCGDFNDTPISYVYRTMKGDLLDPFVRKGFGFGGTYNGLFVPFRIDFLFYSQSLECLSYGQSRVPYSDHYPIFSEFLLH